MKIKLILLFLLSLLLFHSCDKDCKTELTNAKQKINKQSKEIDRLKKDCDDCKKVDSINRKEYELAIHSKLQIDCDSSSVGKVFHYDIVNGYEIIGIIDSCKDGKLGTITFRTREPGNCNKYKIEEVSWKRIINTNTSSVINNRSASDSNSKSTGLTHILVFKVSVREREEANTSVSIEGNDLMFKSYNVTGTYIVSTISGVGIDPSDFPYDEDPIDIVNMVDRNSPICPTIIWGG